MTSNDSTPDDSGRLEPYELSAPPSAPKSIPPEVKYPELAEIKAVPASDRAVTPAPSGARTKASATLSRGQNSDRTIEEAEINRLLQYSSIAGGNAPRAAWKNWRLEGGGFHPIAIYGSLALLFGAWLAGACILSTCGPWATLILLGALFAIVYRISANQRLREQREWAGECPKCGYDLRATPDVCPECGTPVPDALWRRRRTEERVRQKQLGTLPGAGGQRVD